MALVGGREACQGVDQVGIQERRTDLQAAPHAGPVNLEEDVVGQVSRLIKFEARPQPVAVGVELLAPAQVFGFHIHRRLINQEPSDLVALKRPEPALVSQRQGLTRPPKELFELEIEAEVVVVDR